MESNLSFFSLPFLDNGDVDFSKIKCDYDDLHPTLPTHGSLLGADDVLAQFLSGDEPLEEPDLNGPTTLHCEICRKQFDNAKKYYGHLRVHSKDNLWICEKCPNEKFSTKQQLMKHSLIHKPLERVWQCPQCDMSFEALWRLQQHLFAKHLNCRPHKCETCEMVFHKLSDLKKHQDIHDNVKKYECKICKMKLRDPSNAKRHMLSHGSERPFPCSGCGNKFKQLASMKRHAQKCPMVKPDTEIKDKSIRNNYCRVCGSTFKYKSALLEHCVRQHSDDSTPSTTKDIVKDKKSDELHVDTNRTVSQNKNRKRNNKSSCPIKSDTNSEILISHLPVHQNTKLINILSSDNDSVNIERKLTQSSDSIHPLNKSPSQIVNINNQPLNFDSNNTINVDTNPITIPTNQLDNINTSPLNLTTTQHVALDINRSDNVHIDTNPSIPIELNRPPIIDTNGTVDNIVDDILSAEDDYLVRHPISNQMLNYNPPDSDNNDNLMQIELLKDMNQMQILDDELLYNDLDFESFQTMCNTNDMDYTDRNELLFDIADGRSIDQDLLNALYQVKGDNLSNELLNEPEVLNSTEKVNDFLTNPAVSVNECSTIFETDVDLEASTNLAANLNQLIGENSVQYISTEHDDTFIISLNSEIDAEQLTDMLNIGVGSVDDNTKNVVKETNKDDAESVQQPIVVTLTNVPENVTKPIQSVDPLIPVAKLGSVTDKENIVANVEKTKAAKTKTRVVYVCRKCNKIFAKKDNYLSHRATHDSSLRSHKCKICGETFSYKSTLNKHFKKLHTPIVKSAHHCTHCDKTYSAAWMLKRHLTREHEMLHPFVCDEPGCSKKFYQKCDLDIHKRFHIDDRPYTCEICNRRFFLMSHYNRHVRKVDCTNKIIKNPDISTSSSHKIATAVLITC